MAEQLKIDVVLRNFAGKELKTLEKGLLGFTKTGIAGFKSLGGAIFSVKGLLVGLGAGLAIRGISRMVKETADAADKIGDLSTELGVSTEALSELDLAAKQSGAGMDELATGFRFLQKSLGEFASTGRGAIRDVFSQLGPQFRTLVNQGAPVEEVFQQISREIKGLGDAERVFVASKLFGRGGSKLLPLLVEDLDRAREAMRRFGGTITREMAADADKFNDTLGEVSAAFSGLQTQVVAKILPELTKALKAFIDVFLENKPAILNFVADLIDSFGTMAQAGFNIAAGFSVVTGSFTKLGIQSKILVASMVGTEEEVTQLREELALAGDATEDAADAWRLLGTTSKHAATGSATAIRTLALETGNAAVAVEDLGTSATVAMKELEQIPLKTTEAMFEATNAMAGAGRAFADLRQASMQWGAAANKAVGDVADSLHRNLSDGILDVIEGTKKAKDAFRDFAKAMLKDIARIIVETLVLKAVQGTLGGIGRVIGGAKDGGVFPGHIKPVSGHLASGGIVRRRGLFEIGEGGQHEAVVPLVGNRFIPTMDVGRGKGGKSPVNVTVVINYNSQAMTQKQQGAMIQEQAKTIAQVVGNEIRQSPAIREAFRAA